MVSALKEWLPVVREAGRGNTTLLFRRGGILDRTFELRPGRCLLFPTTFHVQAEAQYLKSPIGPDVANLDIRRDWPTIPCDLAFDVTGAWSTRDRRITEALDPWHCYGPRFVEDRLRGTDITVMEVRVHRLRDPVVLQNIDRYFGCFAWCDELDSDVDAVQLEDAVACVEDNAFRLRQELLRDALRALDVDDML